MADEVRKVAMPNGGFQKVEPLRVRFQQKVSARNETDCWIWQGYVGPEGYGLVRDGANMRPAHQVALELAGFPRPSAPNNHALHGDSCVARSCVNPSHLRWGSNADNVADRERLGRNKVPRVCGERQGSAKLTEEKVRMIRAECGRQRDIAAKYGICQMTVSHIKSRKTWAHVQ